MMPVNRTPRSLPAYCIELLDGHIGSTVDGRIALIFKTATVPAVKFVPSPQHLRAHIDALEQAMAMQWPGEDGRDYQVDHEAVERNLADW
jgi:hypothetical protein